MPHIKSFMRHSDAGDEIAWILIGSHNLSIAAWGEIQNKTTEPFLAINSFELSVLIHPALLTPSATAPFSLSGPAFPVVHEQVVTLVAGDRADWASFEKVAGGRLVVPLPYHLPTARYAAGDVAWICDVEKKTRDGSPWFDGLGNTWPSAPQKIDVGALLAQLGYPPGENPENLHEILAMLGQQGND
mmetsp:Transcript_17985/g.41772  ORF Transcript_17985/g.41772 Transcript_17985/m.41772 type:complete len:187 (+) Transcript_17985:231-791(+)